MYYLSRVSQLSGPHPNAGLFLSRREGESSLVCAQRALGRGILRIAPWLMKFLSIVGTAAMFLVGGGILTHNVPAMHHAIQMVSPPGLLGSVIGMLADLLVCARRRRRTRCRQADRQLRA